MTHVKTINRLPLWATLGTTAFLAVLALAGCGHQATNSSDTSKEAAGSVLRVGFIGTRGGEPAGPEGWAYRKGVLLPALQGQGISKIQWTAFPNGPDLNEVMASGAIDVGMLGDTPGVVGHAAGMPTRLINQTAVGNNAYLVVRADGPKTVEELKGKTVATQKGSYMARYLLGLLDEKHLTQSVKFVHLMSTDSESALQRGDIAAYAASNGPLMVSHGFRVIDQAKDHPGLEGSGVTVVTQSYLAAHPSFPAAWNQARVAAIAEVKRHQDEYYSYEAAKVKIPIALYKALYPSRVYDTQPLTPKGLALLEGTKAFLVRQHLAKTNFALKDWIYAAPAPTQTAANVTKP